MKAPPADASSSRLARLGRYLQEDPANPALLSDAFETALSCGQHEEAQAFLATAQGLALAPAEWDFRQARLCIARKELPQAAKLLERLRQAACGDLAVLAHDLGYVRLLQGDADACRALVQPWLDSGSEAHGEPGAAAVLRAMQLLWMRAMHRLHRLDEAWAWALRQHAAGSLHPAALGAASLVAIDRSDFPAAREFSEAALAADPAQVEALVARATVALARGESAEARGLLLRALACNPEDGRTWSALGFASLQARELPRAAQQLEQALRTVPGHIGTWHALGWARLLQGDRDAAREAFEQALRRDANFAESHGALGLVLMLAGEAEQARHHLDVADRLDRQNLTARYARALLAGEAQDADRLRALALRLLDRPGFFGGKLHEAFSAARSRP